MTESDFTPEVGDWFRFEAPDGRTMSGKVTDVEDDTVVFGRGSVYTVSHDALIAKVTGSDSFQG